MKRHLELAVALFCVGLASACVDRDKAPAQSAIAAAESAASRLAGEVARFAPAEAQAAQDALAEAKGLWAARDYKRALAAASAVPTRVNEAVAASAARKGELTKAWTEASRDVENLVYAVEDRLDELAGARKLPKGLGASDIVWARASLAAITSGWAKAPEQVQQGDLAGAIVRAQEAGTQAREILRRIGMP